MPWWLIVILSVAGGVLLLWLVLIGILWSQRRSVGGEVAWREVLRLVPDVIRLISRLARDPEVPRATRWWLLGLLGYLILPIDLVPDFLPIIGYADDAIAVALVLRLATRAAGADAIRRHWPGTAEGLRTVMALVGHDPGRGGETRAERSGS